MRGSVRSSAEGPFNFNNSGMAMNLNEFEDLK